MNLFRHKLVILIVLSWVAGIATVVCFFIPDLFWITMISFLGCTFFRMSIPRPGEKRLVDKKAPKSDKTGDVESGWGINSRSFDVENFLDRVGFFCIFYMLGTSGVLLKMIDLVHKMIDLVQAQRQNPLLIVGLVAYGVKLIAKDIRYFSNIPERDLESFYAD